MTYTTADLDARLAAAERIAREAGALALAFFLDRKDLVVERKSDAQDRVSQADRQVEELIRARVAEAFPGDGFLGEETGTGGGTTGFTWVIDPIDGTSPFLFGLADWCVSVAVAYRDEPVIGVIEAPRHGETWVGAKGRGATLNGRRLELKGKATITDGFFAVGASLRAGAEATGAFISELMRRGGVNYHNGSGALMLASVAGGRLVGYFDRVIMAYDCFAGLVLVREAGGVARFEGPELMTRGGALTAGSAAVMRTVEEIRAATE